jgi:hypothetical protein
MKMSAHARYKNQQRKLGYAADYGPAPLRVQIDNHPAPALFATCSTKEILESSASAD